MKKLLLFLGILFLHFNVFAQVPFPTQTPPQGVIAPWGYEIKGTNWDTSPYLPFKYNQLGLRIMPPNGVSYNQNSGEWIFEENEQYPLIVFFHGAGEIGDDNNNQLKHGGKIHRDAVLNGTFNGFLLYPQKEAGSARYWSSGDISAVYQVIQKLIQGYQVDPNRIVIHGLSMGGVGVWNIANAHPSLFAGILSMSGSTTISANALKFTPVWQTQGGRDQSPSPDFTQNRIVDPLTNLGGNLRYEIYENLGHGVWNRHYSEPDFFPFINRAHKANPWVLYEQSEFCPGDAINVTIGVTAGFDSYEWRRDGVTINGTSSNTISVTEKGVYDVRIRRGSEWSVWSPLPVEIKTKEPTVTPPIQLSTLQSTVIPSPSSNFVTLELPEGYEEYEWRKLGSNTVIGRERFLTVSNPGGYTATVTERFGCSSNFSDPFIIISDDGTSLPDPITGLTGKAISKTEIELNWADNPSPQFNETNFEVYRAEQAGGPYEIVTILASDVLNYVDQDLVPDTEYFYLVRPINDNGAAPVSSEANVKTQVDSNPPTAPLNLRVINSNQNSVQLAWDASTDDVGIKSYDVYRNGVKALVTATNSTTVFNLTASRLYNFQVKAKDLSDNESTFSNQVTVATLNSGLQYKYYEGTWSKLPDFEALTPIKTGTSSNVDISIRNQNNNFGFLWEGYVNIPQAGTYKFETRSDDGSKLYITDNGSAYSESNLVVNNDGLHGNRYRSGNYTFAEAGAYPIAITFFERGGGQNMEVFWTRPGQNSREKIPDGAFREDFNSPGSPPSSPSQLQAVAASFSSIDLSWNDDSNNESSFQVYRATNPSGPFYPAATIDSNVVIYRDNNLQAETTYYYRILAINSFGESGFSNDISATTLPLPPAPEAPTDFTITALSSSSIQLTWGDISNNEEYYEIYRSVGNDQNFLLLTTVNANVEAFLDDELFTNVEYYYYIVAINEGGSNASQNLFSKTLNNAPVLSNIDNFTIRYDEVFDLNLFAEDPDQELLFLSGTNLPPFAQFTDYGDGSGLIRFSPTAGDIGAYEVTVRVEDENEGLDQDSFTVIVNENFLPIIDEESDVQIEEGSSTSINLLATDQNIEDNLVWSATLPEFASLIDNGDGSAFISINPSFIHSGNYQLDVKVEDGQGGVALESFTLVVIDQDPNINILVNFTSPGINQGGVWNNTSAYQAGSVLSNLTDVNGGSTEVQIEIVNGFQYYGSSGVNSSGVYPTNVTRTYFFDQSSTTKHVRIANIPDNHLCEVIVFASRDGSGARITNYTINGTTKSLNVLGNTTNTVNFEGLLPDVNDGIDLYVDKGSGAPYLYLTALELKLTPNTGDVPAIPTGVSAQLIENNTIVQVTWNDRAFNETAYEIYRSETLGGSFELIGSVNKDVDQFSDDNVRGGTEYFYKIRAVNLNGSSTLSDAASILVPNIAPIISSIDDVVISAGEVLEINLSATDDPDDQISITGSNLPSFVALNDLGNGTGTITIAPSIDDIGEYTSIKIDASDQLGETSSELFNITVNPEDLEVVLLNFTDNNSFIESGPWNNLVNTGAAGASIENLTSVAGNNTGMKVTLLDAWAGANELGVNTGNNSGVHPDRVIRSALWEGTTSTKRIRVSGLDPTKFYDVTFFASRSGDGSRVTEYSVAGSLVSLNAMNNSTNTVTITKVAPDQNGQIILSSKKSTSSAYGYLNSLEVKSYPQGEIPVAPTDLNAAGISKTEIQLSWKDNAPDESGYEIWRSSSLNGTYTLLTTVDSNTTTFTNSDLSSNTTYYYKVRAIFASETPTDFSNSVGATTVSFTVSINFNNFDPAASPWNNFNSTPDPGLTKTNLTDDRDQNSGISIKILEESLEDNIMGFSGDNSRGMIIGDDSGIVPDNVMRSTYWLDPGRVAQLKVSGLDLSFRYNFVFFASRDGAGNRTTEYTINGESVFLNASYNVNNTVQINNVEPDQNGTIFIEMVSAPGSLFGYIGGLVIQASDVTQQANIRKDNFASKNIIADEGISAEIERLQNIIVFPNPFTNQVNIEAKGWKNRDFKVKILDLAGKLLYSLNRTDVPNWEGRANSIIIDTDNLKQGLYILEISDDSSEVYRHRLIKQ